MSASLYAAILTVLIEGMTILFRFGFKMQSTRDTAIMKSFTFGYRIHHGYVGLLLMLIVWLWPEVFGKFANAAMGLGIALLLSDLIHHFIVLWWVTGDPQFDLRYPD